MTRTLERLGIPPDEEVADVAADPIPAAPPTSIAMRVAAAATLAGSVAVGVALGRSRRGERVAAGMASATVVGTLALVVAALRDLGARRSTPARPVPSCDAQALPFVTILVASRDEAITLPRLLHDLVRQDHVDDDGPRYEVLVIDDRSTDATAAVVRDAARRARLEGAAAIRLVARRGTDLADGKGAALRSVPSWLPRGELLLVLDADARVDPTFVRRAARVAADGHDAITARRRMLGTAVSRLAQAQDDEQTADLLLQLGRRALGGCAELRGNGVAVTREALGRAGGWPADALTEDLELSTRLALAGVAIEPSLELVVREAPVAGLGALWTQRVRWAEGSVRRYLALGPSIVSASAVSARRRLDLAVYGLQLVVPGIVLGAVVGGVRGRGSRAATVLVGSYAVTAVAVSAVAIAALEPERRPKRGLILARAVRAAVFSGFWLLVVPVSFLRVAIVGGELRYRKTTHRRIDC